MGFFLWQYSRLTELYKRVSTDRKGNNMVMSGIQTITKFMPKTGTQVIQTYNKGIKIAKTVIPGAGNIRAKHISSMVTSFANGKPQTLTMSQRCGLGDNFLVGVFNKTWERGKELFKIVDFIKP